MREHRVGLEARIVVGSLALWGALGLIVLGTDGCVRAGFDAPQDGRAVSDHGLPVDGGRDGISSDGTLDLLGDGGVAPGMWKTISKGTFPMGSPLSEPCRGADEGQHQVTLTHHFELQATEVTQGQFLALMGYNPAVRPCNPSDRCPVNAVNWHESAAYCNALSRKEGEAPCYACSGSDESVTCQEAAAYSGQNVYDCPGYRLPTEAEWEHAYRAGTTTAYYSGVNTGTSCNGCDMTDTNAAGLGWYCANAQSNPHPVKGKPPNAWGLYDMAGNVWEWCHDWYQASAGSGPTTDPWGAPSGLARVLRGGSWSSPTTNMRAASRYSNTPNWSYYHTGFRCSRTK